MDTKNDLQLESTNGGWAFVDSHPRETGKIVEMAINAGLILMGKANLSVSSSPSS
jgi:amidase